MAAPFSSVSSGDLVEVLVPPVWRNVCIHYCTARERAVAAGDLPKGCPEDPGKVLAGQDSHYKEEQGGGGEGGLGDIP